MGGIRDALGGEELGEAGSQLVSTWLTGSIVSQSLISGLDVFAAGSVMGGTVRDELGRVRSAVRSHAGSDYGLFVQAGSILVGDSNTGTIEFAENFSDTNFILVVSPASYTIAGVSGLNYGVSGTTSISGATIIGGSTTVCNWIAVGL